MARMSARSKAMLPGFIFMALGTIVILRFGALMLVLTLLPSLVVFFVDRSEGRAHFRVIAACNIAMALPMIVQIITLSLAGRYDEVGQLTDDPFAWIRIYCGPAGGWGLLHLSKFVARIVTLMHYEYAIKVLQRKQDILLNEWGEAIIPANSNQRITN